MRKHTRTAKNKIRRTRGEVVFDFVNVLFVLGFSAIILYPFLNILAVSFSGISDGFLNTVTVFPKKFTWEAYSQIITNGDIWRSYGNSVFVAVVGAVITVVLTALAAYPLAFADFPGKKLYNIFIVVTMWFSAGIIPSYMVVRSLGLLDSHWALILPAALSAYNIIVLRTTFQGLPDSLIDSARIDGAGEFRILFQVVIPLTKAGIAVIALWTIVGHWNAYTGPLLYITSQDKYVLQQVVNKIVNAAAGAQEMGITAGDGVQAIGTQVKNAALMFTLLPMVIIFPLVQKYFVKGALIGSVKG